MLELLTIPENDDWIYSTGPARVCSSFVLDILKSSGVFGDVNFHVTEMTPKDMMDLNIWNDSPERVPEVCKNSMAGKFCQIMGNVHMKIHEYNVVKPYNNMSLKCPTIPPLYERNDNC